jgi:hypothetical protein
MTAYTGQTWTTLGKLCTALWDSKSRPVAIQLGETKSVRGRDCHNNPWQYITIFTVSGESNF